MIEKAEDFLRKYSSQIRVRMHNNIARIEIPIECFDIVLSDREKIVDYLKNLGFVYVTIDLEGFRSGSMNEELIQLGKR